MKNIITLFVFASLLGCFSLSAQSKLTISEVAPWSSGVAPISADWFEVTNNGTTAVDITGWKMDDNSNSASLAVPISGVTSIAAGESVILIESATTSGAATVIANFKSVWFNGNTPVGLQIGTYTGGGVGLSGTADAVNLFNSSGTLQANVTFGASPSASPYATFDNTQELNNAAISTLSVVGTNNAFVAASDSSQTGSPGKVGTPSVTVSLTSPTTGVTFAASATVSIAAATTVSNGIINKVEFYNGSTLLGTSTTSPYSYSWTSVTVGSYAITAKAYDNLGGITTSTAVNVTVKPVLTISEVAPWSSGVAPISADWFEVTNNGTTAIDITGWKMDDNSNSFSLAVPISGVTSIAAGESVILIESATTSGAATVIANFKSVWFNGNTPAGLQIGTYTGGGVGLSGTADAVNLFNSSGVLQANVTFGVSSSAAPYATFDNAQGVNNAAISLLSVVGTNGTFVGALDSSQIGSPGKIVNPNSIVTISLTSPATTDAFTAPATVSIAASTTVSNGTISKVEFYNGSTLLGTSTTSPYSYSWTSVVAGSYSITAKAYDQQSNATTSTAVSITVNAAASSPTIAFVPTASKLVDAASGKITCVKGDPTDFVSVSGLDINVTDQNLSTLSFKMTSSNTSLVANTDFTVTGTGSARKFKITPSGANAGYTTITLTVTNDGGLSSQISFTLAVSLPFITNDISNTYGFGSSDASDAIVIDDNYMFISDDQSNFISLYNRKVSGLPIYTFDPTQYLALTDDLSVDIEAAFISPTNPNRIYWVGSQSNSSKGNVKPDRDRVFATDIVGTGANTTLTFVGYRKGLRSQILSWGDANGLGLTADAAQGQIAKEISGYNIEGAAMAPDNTTLYLGFRAPYLPAGTQNKALICPLQNFETWFNSGSTNTVPTFGTPIQIDLGTRGIRDIAKNASNQYVISAGAFDGTSNFALYSWDGQSTSAPVALCADLTGLSPEGIALVPSSITGSFQIQLISDNGGDIIYNDGIESKAITALQYRRFIMSNVNVNAGIVNQPTLACWQTATWNGATCQYDVTTNKPTISAITGTTNVTVNANTQLASSTIGGVWTSSDDKVVAINLSNGLLTGVSSGKATISYTITNGVCQSSVTTDITVMANLGNQQFDSVQSSYYPNPVKNLLNISNSNAIKTVYVYNLLGQEMTNQSVNSTSTTIDMSRFPNATYMVKIETENGINTLKVIKE